MDVDEGEWLDAKADSEKGVNASVELMIFFYRPTSWENQTQSGNDNCNNPFSGVHIFLHTYLRTYAPYIYNTNNQVNCSTIVQSLSQNLPSIHFLSIRKL